MLAVYKRSPKLSLQALRQKGNVAYYYYGIKSMFSVDSVICLLYLVTRNKIQFEKVAELLDFLFL
jgi:hypothetical protein